MLNICFHPKINLLHVLMLKEVDETEAELGAENGKGTVSEMNLCLNFHVTQSSPMLLLQRGSSRQNCQAVLGVMKTDCRE